MSFKTFKILPILFCAYALNSCAQNTSKQTTGSSDTSIKSVDLLFDRVTLKQVDSLEVKAGSKLFKYNFQISIGPDYVQGIKGLNLANPVIYDISYPGLSEENSYYYSVPDKVLRVIEYSWDGSSNDAENLQKLFAQNKQSIVNHFKNDNTVIYKEWDSGEKDWKGKNCSWESKDTYVSEFSVLGSGTYRVRILISWK